MAGRAEPRDETDDDDDDISWRNYKYRTCSRQYHLF